MSLKLEKICRLCLNLVKNKFAIIDEVIKQMLDILFLKLDLDITSDPIICHNCVAVAKKCLNFKSSCLDTERIILLFSTGREDAKHDIRVIYKERECIDALVGEALDICRFCMTRSGRNNFTSLDTLRRELIMFEMLLQYMPEMDLDIIEDPLICTICRHNFEDYFKLVVKCVDIERKITAYCKEEGIDNIVNLENVLKFSFKNVLERPGKCPIKEDSSLFEDTESVYPTTYSELINIEKVYIKEEGLHLEKSSCNNVPKIITRYGNIRNKTTSDMISFKSEECEQRTEFRERAKRNEKNNINDNEILKGNLWDISPIKVHKCSLCAYESNHRNNLRRHMFVHKDLSEIKWHKCHLCDYQAKQKRSLDAHFLIHKDVSEIKMHKCSLCAYKTKWKSSLKVHLLVHKDVSEIKMHKCSLCAYSTKLKCTLRSHMLVHKDVSKIMMYKCSLCTYETKRKGDLISHMFVHKDVSELEMHKCSLCTFETKQKRCLKRHMLLHTDLSQVKMHKCSLCTYEAKQKNNLKRHIMSVHKDIPEVNNTASLVRLPS